MNPLVRSIENMVQKTSFSLSVININELNSHQNIAVSIYKHGTIIYCSRDKYFRASKTSRYKSKNGKTFHTIEEKVDKNKLVTKKSIHIIPPTYMTYLENSNSYTK